MAGKYRYQGSRRKKKGNGGWLLLGFCMAFALLLRYGQSQPLIELRQRASAWLVESQVYEQAVAQVGKLFSGDEETDVKTVFGQLFFGQEQKEQ